MSRPTTPTAGLLVARAHAAVYTRQVSLSLGENWPAWHPTARRGTLDEATDVLVLLAAHQPGSVSKAREDASLALEARGPGVLALLAVRPENNRVAWIYEGIDGVALSRLPEESDLGHRAAVELVARVAEVVLAHPHHPGPEPDDVLLAARGEVRVAGFARPFAGNPSFRPPGPGDLEARQVYRLGALLACLLGGPCPPGSDTDAHDAAVRRAVIRAMSAPGAVFSERYAELLRAMLSYEPTDRPPMTRVVEGLCELAEHTPGPTLGEVCDRYFQRWLAEALGDDPDETTLPQGWEVDELVRNETIRAATAPLPLEERIFGDLTVEDEPTVDSEMGLAPTVERTPPAVERGSIPVAVGPPPEVASKRPTLPLDLFEETVPGAPSDATTVVRGPAPAPTWLRYTAVVLVLIAAVLVIWLIYA